MNHNFAILVLSCDKFSDLWEPFFYCFFKQLPDCPYPIYLGINELEYKPSNAKIQVIHSGEDLNWSRSLKKILSQIKEENIYIILEDVFLTSPMDEELLFECLEILNQDNTYHIHSKAGFSRNLPLHSVNLSILPRGIPYRVNLLGFWKKKYLEWLLIDGESPWGFEVMGSYRVSFQDGFYTVNRELFEYIHVVEKGMILPNAYEYCKKNNIPVRFEKWKISSNNSYFIYLQKFRGNLE